MKALAATVGAVAILAAGSCATPRKAACPPSAAAIAPSAPGHRAAYVARYEQVFYGSSDFTTPNAILRLDNNEAIAEACVGGKTADQLAALGVRFVSSQLNLLLHYGLLEQQGRRYRTTFPVLDRKTTASLRLAMREDEQPHASWGAASVV